MRPFSLKHHPENVATFEATSMVEALLLADQAHREGADAGIWIDPKMALDRPRQHDQMMEQRAACHAELTPHLQRAIKLRQQFARQTYKMPAPGLDPQIEQRRFAGLMSLRIVFKEVLAEGRVQTQADYAPHIDPDPQPEIPAQDDNLFQSKHVKILCIQYGDGMLGFDRRDAKRFEMMGTEQFTSSVHPKWYMKTGDVAFFQGRFLHSAAPINLAENSIPRVADIQDCSGGIPLALVRKLA